MFCCRRLKQHKPKLVHFLPFLKIVKWLVVMCNLSSLKKAFRRSFAQLTSILMCKLACFSISLEAYLGVIECSHGNFISKTVTIEKSCCRLIASFDGLDG